MKDRITTFIAMTLVCCLCFGTAAHAQEPAVGGDVPEDVRMETPARGTVPGDGAENAETDVREPEVAAVQEVPEDTGENVVQVQITSMGVSRNTGDKVQEVPRSKKIRVLMVGNSLTYCARNRTVSDLEKMAKKAKRKISIKRLTYNNEKLANWANPRHKNGKRLYREIRSGKWDYIVLQEQTDASVKPSFIKESKKLAAYIHKKSPKTQIIYNCTWAYKKGKKISGKKYSFSRMQKTMNQNYQTVARQTGGRVCRSGDAFLKYRKSSGKKKNLYLKDNNHASRYGWYLNACCLYGAIFGASPVESGYYGGIGKSLAKKFQRIAASQM